MTRKIILSLAVASSLSLYGADVEVITTGAIANIEQNDAVVDKSFQLSTSLVELTNNIVDQLANANNQNTQAMLQLSQDIGTMSDRINSMADKIVSTQEIQSKNFTATQDNMLEAQQNMLDAISELSQNNLNISQELATQLQINMQNAKSTIGEAQNNLNNTQQTKAVEKIKESIKQSPSVQDLIGQLDNVKPQYKFMVMNAIKAKMAKENSQNRAKSLKELTSAQIQSIQKEIVTTQERTRDNKQSNMQGSNSATMNTQVSLDNPYAGGIESRGGSDAGASAATSGAASGASSASNAASGASAGGAGGGMGGSSSGGMGGM